MTARGKFVVTLLILGIVGFGGWKWFEKFSQKNPFPGMTQTSAPGSTQSSTKPNQTSSTQSAGDAAQLASALEETLSEPPKLAAPGVYQAKGNVVELELSEYAGYAGLIVANGGLEPSENSQFFKKHGFKVKITLSEEESWSSLNSGKIAASATTVDVLAIFGRQYQGVVPAQIGYSRGADGVVVRKEIKRINNLKGKILATAQFTEADFFIRYLAQEAGLGVRMLPDLKTTPDPEKVNLVFCKDAFAAGDLFLKDIKDGLKVLAGCVTWAPKTSQVAQDSGGQAHILATSLNLLIIADILTVNKGFAQQNPDKVAGLVSGLLEGNRLVRDNPSAWLDLIGKAFKWDREKTKAELAKVHLANLPENLAFFSGSIDSAGSFNGIYQSSIYAYGSELIKDPVDGDRFADQKPLQALDQSGAFKEQKVSIAPIKSATAGTIEGSPLLSKDIRFLFEPNSATLKLDARDNQKNLDAIRQLLQVSPGSTILLRGHVDNAMVEDFRKKGGDPFVRQMALKATELSKNRAGEIKRLLMEKFKVDASRLDTVGRGWEEPLGTDNEQNRRVEAQWFTVE